MSTFSFTKDERLLNRKEFVNLNRAGERFQTSHFIIIFMKNRLGISRLGITASKKVGNSVKRNRIKRLIREFYRLHKHSFPQGYDTLFVAKAGVNNLNYWTVQEELSEFVLDKKARILS